MDGMLYGGLSTTVYTFKGDPHDIGPWFIQNGNENAAQGIRAIGDCLNSLSFGLDKNARE